MLSRLFLTNLINHSHAPAMENYMKKKKSNFNDILFLVALYAMLIFGYQHVQTFKEQNRKNAILLEELEQKYNKDYVRR